MGNKLPLRILRGILCLAFWIFVWQMLALAVRRVLVLPTPLAVAKTLGSLLSDGEFYLVCLWSLGRIFAGLLIGLFAGLLLAALFAALSILPASAGNDRIIVVGELPAAAQQFITTHFKGVEVSYAKVDEDWFDKEYKVVFVNGSKVEFLKNGDWKEVDCKYGEVPAGVVPAHPKRLAGLSARDLQRRGRRL